MKSISILYRNYFIKNVAILMSGTALSQSISIISAPILTRLYDPKEFGIFSVYMSIVYIVGSVSSLRYELAIVLPKKEIDAARLMILACSIVMGVAVFSLLIVTLCQSWATTFFNISELSFWLWWIPLSILVSGSYTVLSYWLTRQKQFWKLSVSEVLRSGITSGSQVISGLAGGGISGLVGGLLAGNSVVSLGLGIHTFFANTRLIRDAFNRSGIKQIAVEYKNFPLFNSSTTLVNVVSQNVPSFLLAYFFNPEIAGFFALANRLIQVPLILIGDSIRKVFLQKASVLFNEQGDVYSLLKKTTLWLSGIAIGPALLIFFMAPYIFSLLLGVNWNTSGIYARWLVLSMFVNFINIPSIELTRVLNLQKQCFYNCVYILIGRVFVLGLAGYYFNPLIGLILYSGVGALINVTFIVTIFNTAKKMMNKSDNVLVS